jgi:hypothetical protein
MSRIACEHTLGDVSPQSRLGSDFLCWFIRSSVYPAWPEAAKLCHSCIRVGPSSKRISHAMRESRSIIPSPRLKIRSAFNLYRDCETPAEFLWLRSAFVTGAMCGIRNPSRELRPGFLMPFLTIPLTLCDSPKLRSSARCGIVQVLTCYNLRKLI